MALTNDERARIRKAYFKVRGDPLLPYTKTELNAALDGFDQWYQDNKAAAAAAIETAAPGIFDNIEKRRMAAAYFWFRFKEDLV